MTGQTASIRDTGIPEEQVFILKSAKITASVTKNWTLLLQVISYHNPYIRQWQQDESLDPVWYLFPWSSTHWSSNISSVSTGTESFSKHVKGEVSVSKSLSLII